MLKIAAGISLLEAHEYDPIHNPEDPGRLRYIVQNPTTRMAATIGTIPGTIMTAQDMYRKLVKGQNPSHRRSAGAFLASAAPVAIGAYLANRKYEQAYRQPTKE
jgi:hypothetical protein